MDNNKTAIRIILHLLKFLNDHLFIHVVNLCNTCIKMGDLISEPGLRKVWLIWFSECRDAIQYLVDIPGLQAYRVWEGDLEILFIGSNFGAETIAEYFPFNEKPHIEHVRSLYYWNISKITREWLKADNHILVSDSHRSLFRKPEVAYAVDAIVLIDQVMETASVVGSRNSEYRGYRSKREKEALSLHLSKEPTDFEYFYNKIYKPYMEYRHGPINTYPELFARFKRGGILFVDQNNQHIAGSLIFCRKDCLVGFCGGITDADPILHKRIGFSTIIGSTIQWGEENGLSRVDLGGSYAFLTNGRYIHKRNWRAKVVDYFPVVYNHWMVLFDHPSPEVLERLNKFGLITKKADKYYRVILPEDSEGNFATSTNLTRAVRDGLDGIAEYSGRHVEYVC